MSQINRTVAMSSIGGGGTILAFFTWLFEPKEITDFISENPKIVLATTIILFVIICIFVKIFSDKVHELKTMKDNKEEYDTKLESEIKAVQEKAESEIKTLKSENERTILELEKKKEELKNSLQQDTYEEGQTWKHTVLLVDDDPTTLDAIKDELQGFDVVGISRIDDYRLAAEFEIIVSDIFGCGPSTTVASVLNMIKQKYPYKFVLAMSAQPAACNHLDTDGEIIFKDDNYKFVISIREKLILLGDKLDCVSEHWEEINRQLQEKKKSPKQIKAIKSNYYRFVNKMQNGL